MYFRANELAKFESYFEFFHTNGRVMNETLVIDFHYKYGDPVPIIDTAVPPLVPFRFRSTLDSIQRFPHV